MRKILSHLALSLAFAPLMVGASGIDNDTVLMLHFDDSNGSTTFSDSSTTSHSISVVGDVQHTTSESVFGNRLSTRYDGIDDRASSSDSALKINGAQT